MQPAAGDSGTAVGAAYYVWNQELGRPRGFVMEHAYTGPEYDDDGVRGRDRARRASTPSGSTTTSSSARRGADRRRRRRRAGSRGAWSSGRARSATARSSSTRAAHDMKDILNARIKHREPFRPFAPSILAEPTGDWFEQDYTSPFMILVYKTRADKREQIPAVNHVDDTGRLQTVERARRRRATTA